MKTVLPLLIAAVILAARPLAAQVAVTPGPQKVTVQIGGKPFTDFFIAGPEVAKPYLFPLRTASGIYVTRMWPMEKVAEEANIQRPDHPHQRGLWFAHAKVNDLDFWNIAPLDTPPYNRPDRGKIVLQKLGKTDSGKDRGSIAATFDWNGHDGRTLLREARVMTFYNDPALRIIDFDITLTAVQKAVFGDEKDGLFGIRLRPVLNEQGGTGHIVNADGLLTEKALWGKPSNWCDYWGVAEGQTVGVAILDHPQNPRHPVRWHARGYGLFSANPFGLSAFTNDKTQNGEMTLEPGQSARFRYRLIIHPGDTQTADIAAQWKRYTGGK
jgi:hypothetical protein